jgi:hypothetical protein
VAWSPGPVNTLNRPVNLPAVDAGLYLIRGGNPVNAVGDLVLIKNSPNYNEAWPRPVLSYKAIYGVDQPNELPWLPNDGSAHSALPAGTAFGLVGSSSLYKRESFPGFAALTSYDGLDEFNSGLNDSNFNWFTQGADAGKYSSDDIWAVRLVAMEPNTHRSYGPHEGQHFFNHINEKLRILGEIPVRKFDAGGNPILDSEGNPDTSFLAKIPADTPFTFQTLDRNGMVLNMAQTWHQVRPGEMRANCGGCHAHSQQPLAFENTAASQANYVIANLNANTPLLSKNGSGQPALRTVNQSVANVEFYRDIRPILQRSCAGCHTKADAAPKGNLVLDDLAMYPGPQFTGMQFPGDYSRLCFDANARWGYPSLVKLGGQAVWRNNNASRYVRLFQSRRSLLLWKIFGQRLDGWTNADHPTETTPGDAATLPGGASAINRADLDYTGSIMPPPNSGYPALSDDEKMNMARWVDLGCPINEGENDADKDYGWYLDDVRPALAVSAPRPGLNTQALSFIRVGVADAYSGIKPNSLSITASIPLAGRAAGAQLADLAGAGVEGVFTIPLATALSSATDAHLFASVQDNQGNFTRVNVKFSVNTTGQQATATPQPTATTVRPTPTAIVSTPTPTPTDVPLPNCAITINNGQRFTNSRVVTVRANVNTAQQLMLSNDGGFVGATWQSYMTSNAWTLENVGTRIATLVVYARARLGMNQPLCSDLAISDDIIYDPLAPSLTLAKPNGAQLNIAAQDQADGSGVTAMQVSGRPDFADVDWQAYAASVPLPNYANIYVRVRDAAGNVSNVIRLGEARVHLPVVLR